MTSCSCSCDMPELFLTFRRKARKKFVCCECFSDIDPGEEYESHEGKWQGQFRRFRLCLLCAEAIKDLFAHKDFDCDCLAYGDLWQYEELISEMRNSLP